MSLSHFVKKYIDLRLVLLLAAFYTLFDIVYLAKIAYVRNFIVEEVKESWADILIYYILIDWLIVISYMTFISISTKRLLDKKYSWVRIFIMHTVLSIFIGLVIRFVFDIQGILMGSFSLQQYSIKESIDRLILVMDFNFLIYFAMIFIVYTYHYLKRVKESEKQKNQLETQLVNTRMEMLSSQLQPHFLFNTLNSIAVLVEMDAKKAQNTIADLSDFLREILYSGNHYTVLLEKELRILKYYLNILTVRFSDHLEVEKKIEEGLLHQKVPFLILQPIIENSVKHGYSYDHTKLSISIQIYSEKNRMVIKIINDGESLALSQEELLAQGVGLSNIRDRLINLYGNKYFFEIRNRPSGAGVETVVEIPLV